MRICPKCGEKVVGIFTMEYHPSQKYLNFCVGCRRLFGEREAKLPNTNRTTKREYSNGIRCLKRTEDGRFI